MCIMVKRLLKKYGYPPDLQKTEVEKSSKASRINGREYRQQEWIKWDLF